MRPNLNTRHRQIHLDFHTSEYCPNVGGDFDEDQFIGALKKGHVDSINVFALGHHGWCYYPTKTDMAHPNLQTDLLGRMIAAAKKADILMPVYITVGWNVKAAREHPEWCVRKVNGMIDGPVVKHPHSPKGQGWYRLCLNSPYVDEVVLPVTREILEMYNPVGYWFDITGEYECVCEYCLVDMKAAGLDPEVAADRDVQTKRSYEKYLKKTTDIVWGGNPDAWIYHNGKERKGRQDLYPYWSHSEIESLPTGGWGYNHFPSNARYFSMLDTEVVSMTGKFHRSWGEFGGFKNPVALRYEVAQMMSLGCRCCVGDQLHPEGVMDEETYRVIGEAYKDVEDREEWLNGAQAVVDVAVLSPHAVMKDPTLDESDVGAAQMLLECQVPFVVLDETMDFSPYKTLVLPDSVLVDDALAAKLNAFADGGGSLILSGDSGLDPTRSQFAIDIGADYVGPSPNDVEYVVVEDALARDVVRSPFVVYETGVSTKLTDGEVLADAWKPYFNRTYQKFCSHRNTPYEGPAGWPAVVRKGRVVHIAQPIFRVYQEQGMQLHRDLFRNVLDLVHPERMIAVDGLPSCGRVSLMRQATEGRDVLHVLYANPIRRGATEVIEDIVPVYDVKIDLAVDAEPKSVTLVPQKEAIEFSCENGRVQFTIPRVELSQMVVIG